MTTLARYTSSGDLQIPQNGMLIEGGYKSLVLSDKPVAYYRLDETSGTTAYDSTLNNLNGIIGSSVTLGQSGATADGDTAMNFASYNGGINLGNPTNLQLIQDLSIEFWVNPAAFDTRRNIICKAYGGEYAVTQETGRGVSFYYGITGINGGSSYQNFYSYGYLNSGTWNHAVITRNLTTGQLVWYVNGVATNSGTATYLAPSGSSLNAYIGKGYTSPYYGLIDEVAFYNYALTSEQVYSHYRVGLQNFATYLPDGRIVLPGEINEAMPISSTASFSASGTTNIAHDPAKDINWWNAGNLTLSGYYPGPNNTYNSTENALQVNAYSSSYNGHSFYLPIVRDKSYVISANVKTSGSPTYGKFLLTLFDTNGNLVKTNYTPPNINGSNWMNLTSSGSYTYAWETYTIPSTDYSTAVYYTIQLLSTGNSSAPIYYKNIQLEQGNTPTQFTNYTLTRPNYSLSIAGKLQESATNVLQFDGTSGYILSNNTSILQITGDLTLETHIQIPNTSFTNYTALISKYNSTGEYEIGLDFRNGKQMLTYRDTNFTSGSIASVSTYAGQWAHVAITRTGGVVTGYVNGVSIGSISVSGTLSSSSYSVTMGKRSSSVWYFPSSMMSCRIYNRALSANELMQNSQGTIVRDSSLVGEWNGTGVGSTVYDLTSNHNDGTINGGVNRIFY